LYAVAHRAQLAECSIEEVIGGIIAGGALKSAGIVGQSAIGSIIIRAGEASCWGISTGHAYIVGGKISAHAHATAIHQLVEKVCGTISAKVSGGLITLVTKSIDTGFTCKALCIFVCESTTQGLAKATGQIEVKKRIWAIPSLHVEYRWAAQRKSASASEAPRIQKFNSKRRLSLDSFICKFPLILEPAVAVYSLESSKSHDEIINKLIRDFNEAAVQVIDPRHVDNEILIGTLHIIGIEYDLTEVYVSD